MRKSQKDIKTLSEAIEHLEKSGTHKAKDLHEAFGKDFDEIKKAFENLKPYFENLKEEAEKEAEKTKTDLEEKIKAHPWQAIGIVGLIAFFIGWLFGQGRK